MTDWTTTDGCERCAEHGPFLLDRDERARDAHQAWHALVAALLAPMARLLDALCR